MALQGSFSGKTANTRITPTITWKAVQSVVGNYSDITATLTYRRDNDYVTGGTWSGSLTIGTQKFTGKKTIRITDDTDAVAISATARVNHDQQGALTVTISATGAVAGSTLTGTQISGSVTLNTIARASTVNASDANIGSCATVVVSRKSSSFTHSIAYRFGQLSGYIDANGNITDTETKFSATTVNFLLPESFYLQIPNAPNGVCTLTCRTYTGSALVGTAQTCSFTATAPVDSCRPIVSGAVADCNPLTVALTGDDSVLVRYASHALCQMDAQSQQGATIALRRIGGVPIEADTLTLEQAAFDSIVFEAVDSRGYATACQVPVTQVDYIPLSCVCHVKRTAPTAPDAVLSLRGSCWKGNFGAAENALSVTVQVNEGEVLPVDIAVGADHQFDATVTLSGMDYRQSHAVKIIIGDKVSTLEQTLTVHKGVPVFDWGENDFQFHVPVDLPDLTIAGVPLADYIRSIVEGA